MSDYPSDRDWSDKLIPAMIPVLSAYLLKVVGPHRFELASFEDDAKRATDVIAHVPSRPKGIRIALRVRGPEVDEKYPWDFTERSRRISGVWVELHKILWRDYADLFLYCHASKCRTNIVKYFLIDLHCFRAWYHAGFPEMWTGEFRNTDRESWLRAFRLSTCPPDWRHMVLASSHPIPFDLNEYR